MTARIRVEVDCIPRAKFIWWCTGCLLDPDGHNERTIAAAADAGLAHLRDVHPQVVWAAGGRVYEATGALQRAYDGSRSDA